LSTNSKLVYIVEEYDRGHQISSLETTSIWLACADFLIKMRSGKKKGLKSLILPHTKTRDANSSIIFINGFLSNKENVVGEVSVKTKVCAIGSNKFDHTKTNEYYLSENYIKALKGLVVHLKNFKKEDTRGLLTLMSFSILDDNHFFWDIYSPSTISDKLMMGGLGLA